MIQNFESPCVYTKIFCLLTFIKKLHEKKMNFQMTQTKLLAIFLLSSLSLTGTDYSWIADSNGVWNESSNWDPTGVPNGDGDTATVTAGSSPLTVTINEVFNNLSYTLAGDQTLAFSSDAPDTHFLSYEMQSTSPGQINFQGAANHQFDTPYHFDNNVDISIQFQGSYTINGPLLGTGSEQITFRQSSDDSSGIDETVLTLLSPITCGSIILDSNVTLHLGNNVLPSPPANFTNNGFLVLDPMANNSVNNLQTGTVLLSEGSTLTMSGGSEGSPVELSANIQGEGGIVFVDTYTLLLSSPVLTNSGTTLIKTGSQLETAVLDSLSPNSSYIVEGPEGRLRAIDRNTVSSLFGAGILDLAQPGGTFVILNGGEFSGTMINPGGMSLTGGTLSLTGDSPDYSGPMTVSNSTLLVNALYSGSSVEVAAGGTLKGSGGTVGPVNISPGGKLQPGASIGDLTVASLTQLSGTTLSIEFDPSTTSHVIVTGSALISDNTTLELIPNPGIYSLGTIYTYLNGGTLDGNFDHLAVANGNLGNLTGALLPRGENTLSFILVLDPLQTVPLSIATSLSTSLNRTQMRCVNLIQDQHYIRNAICQCDRGKYHSYVFFDYSQEDINERTYTSKGSEQLFSGMLGFDFYPKESCNLGLSLGYIYGKAHGSGLAAPEIHSNNIATNAYLQINPIGHFFIEGALAFTYSLYDLERNYWGSLKADFQGYEFASELRLLYQADWNFIQVRPYVGAIYYLDQIDSYTEKGEFKQMSVGKNRFDFVDVETGLAIWTPIRAKRWTIVPQVTGAYVTTFMDDPHSVRIGGINGLNDSILIDSLSDHYWKIDAEVEMIFGACSEFFLNYQTVFDDAYHAVQRYSAGLEFFF